MRTIVYRAFLILAFLLLTVQVFNDLLGAYKPDILLILTIYVAQKKGIMEGQLTGFFSGLSEDIFSVELFGIHSFTKLIIGFISGLLSNNFVVDKIGFQFIIGLVGALLHGLLFILAKIVFSTIDVSYYITSFLWVKILFTALLAPLFFIVFDFLEKRFGEP